MKFLAVTLAAVLATNALALPHEQLGKTLTFNSQLEYIGPVTPGGENVTLSGTASSIMDQIKKLNPSFNPDDFEVTREARQRLAARLEDRGNSVTENPASDLMRRAREPVNKKTCNMYGQALLDDRLIRDIYDMPGSCRVNARSCVHLNCRRTCAFTACIHSYVALCNDNNYSIQPTCAYLATYATEIGKVCMEEVTGGFPPLFMGGGQQFDTDHYNVVVGADTKC